MIRNMLMACCLLLVAGCAQGEKGSITVILPEGSDITSLQMEEGYIKDVVAAKRGQNVTERLTVPVEKGKATIPTMADGDGQYIVDFGNRQYAITFAKPDEKIEIKVTSLSPLTYTMSGSELVGAMTQMDQKAQEVLSRYEQARNNPGVTSDSLGRLETEYYGVYNNYIENNPKSPAVAYALQHLEGSDFLDTYNVMTPEAKKSIMMPYVELQKKHVERAVESEKRKAALESGTAVAPDFTFKDKSGKDVSLSQYRGHWVIVDFWGSWCRWCIKGFPSLKDAYAKYQPELVVIGVACNDSYEAWTSAIAKYELPWVNLYNPEEGGGKLLEDYAVQGFPTKVIIDPEGKIRNITSGDDPNFYTLLSKLMGK